MMKRWFVLLLSLLLAALPSLSLAAEEDTQLTLAVLPSDAADTVTVEVRLSETGGDPVMIQFCLGFDPEKLQCTGAAAGEALADTIEPTMNVTDNNIYFIWDALEPLTDGGVLLRAEFRPKSADARLWIDYDEEFLFADESFQELQVVVENDYLDVTPAAAAEAQAQAAAEQTAAAAEAEPTEQTEAAAEETKSGTGWILLGVGAAAVIGTTAVLYGKKKSQTSEARQTEEGEEA